MVIITLMNKKLSLVILPTAILISGCALGPQVAPPKNIAEKNLKESQKLAQIMTNGGSAFCKVTNLEDNSVTEITVSGKKMRISGVDIEEGRKGIMINDAVYVYSWQEGQNTGFKMKVPSVEEAQNSANEVQATPENTNTQAQLATYDDETKYSLNCTNKSVQDSDFVPPKEISFIDPTALQNMTPQELQKLMPQEKE